MTRQAAMYSRSRGLSLNRCRHRRAIHLDADIRFPQRERNDIHGVGEEIAICVGQADHQDAAVGGIAALVVDRGCGSAVAFSARFMPSAAGSNALLNPASRLCATRH
jgi:hypothetical protein